MNAWYKKFYGFGHYQPTFSSLWRMASGAMGFSTVVIGTLISEMIWAISSMRSSSSLWKSLRRVIRMATREGGTWGAIRRSWIRLSSFFLQREIQQWDENELMLVQLVLDIVTAKIVAIINWFSWQINDLAANNNISGIKHVEWIKDLSETLNILLAWHCKRFGVRINIGF